MAGRFGFDPDGNPVNIPEESLEQALAFGYRLESDEEASARALQEQYGDDEGRAFVEGAARSASLGVSDPLLKGFGIPSSDLKGRKEANPQAALGGEVAGAVGSAFIPGAPVARVAKVGTAIEKGLAGPGAKLAAKILAKTAAGAAEGGIVGAGNAVSQATLDNKPLTADMLFAHMGAGALFGGAGNAAVAGVGAGLKKGAGAVVEAVGEGSGTSDVLRNFARNRALKAAGFIKGDLNKLELERQAQIADDLLEAGVIKAGDAPDDILKAVRTAQKEAGEANGRILKQVDDSLGAQGKAFDATGAFAQIRKDILPAFDDPAFAAQKKKLEKLLTGYEKKAAAGPVTFEQARVWKTNLQKTISKFKDTPIAQQANKELQRAIDDQIEAQLGKVAGDDVLKQYQKAKQLYGSFSEAVKVGKKATGGMIGNRFISLSDHMLGGAGALMSGGPGGMAIGLGTALAAKVLRERGSSILAVAADKLSKKVSIEGALAAFSKRMNEGTSGAIKALVSGGGRAATPAGVTALLDSTLPVFSEKKPKDKHEALVAHLDELAQMSADPKRLLERLAPTTGALSEIDPDLGPAMAAKATKAAEYLHAVAPKPPPGTMLTAFDGSATWKPSDAELSRFGRCLAAVNDPLSVYEDLKQGTVTREAVEALQAVYPELYTDIQRRLLEQLGGVKEQLAYPKRLALAQLFNVDMNTALRPDMLRVLQATFAAANDHQQAQNPAAMPGPGGQPVSLAKDSATTSDRMQARG